MKYVEISEHIYIDEHNQIRLDYSDVPLVNLSSAIYADYLQHKSMLEPWVPIGETIERVFTSSIVTYIRFYNLPEKIKYNLCLIKTRINYRIEL